MATMKQPKIALLGGSGLYHIEGFEQQKWVAVKTPFGSPSDEILTGRLRDREVLFLPRHGRGHRLMPSELNHRANIYALKKLGAAWIVSVSAVGSLQPQYHPCQVVLPDQFVDRTRQSASHSFFGDGIVAHVAFAEPFCLELREILHRSCKKVGAVVHFGGAYVNIEGPTFSTRAESLFYQKSGWDVIGMTNLGEAKCAREAEIAYATLAMVTDYDCWNTEEDHVTSEMVLQNLFKNAALAKAVIVDVISQIPAQPGCSCHRALEKALLTDRTLWPARTRARLKPILEKYLKN